MATFRCKASGRASRAAARPLHLAVRLELEANPGIVAITDAEGIAPGWSFRRGQGDVTDDMPDMLVIGTAGGRTRTQALNIFYQMTAPPPPWRRGSRLAVRFWDRARRHHR